MMSACNITIDGLVKSPIYFVVGFLKLYDMLHVKSRNINRNHPVTAPAGGKTHSCLFNYRANTYDIHFSKIEMFLPVEIFIPDILSAADGNQSNDGKFLIVKASVQSNKINTLEPVRFGVEQWWIDKVSS